MLFTPSGAFPVSGKMILARPYSSSTMNFLTHDNGAQRVILELIQNDGMTWVVVALAAWISATRFAEEVERDSREMRVGRISEMESGERSR